MLTYWTRWNTTYEPLQAFIVQAFEVLKQPDEAKHIEFFHDVAQWRDKFHLLQDTVAFLVATSDTAVGQDLRDRFEIVNSNWEQLWARIERYMAAGDLNRTKKDYTDGLEKLDAWLRKAEDLLSTPQKVESAQIKTTLEKLMVLHSEVSEMEEVFKDISRKFHQLVQELDGEEIEDMMFVLKKEKENLVIIRSMIPTKIQLFHHLLTQLEALDGGEVEIRTWCDQVDNLVSNKANGAQSLQEELAKHRPFLAKTVNMQANVQSKNNVFQSILKNTEGKEGIDTVDIVARMSGLNNRFETCLGKVKEFERGLSGGVGAWDAYAQAEKDVKAWITEAQDLINSRHIESKDSVALHKIFFDRDCDHVLESLLKTSSALEQKLPSQAEGEKVRANTEALRSRWEELKAYAPLHLIKIEFRLDEEAVGGYMREIERQLQVETESFQKSEDVSHIIAKHKEYFSSGDLVGKVEGSLSHMDGLAKSYNKDASLKEAVAGRRAQWEALSNRIQTLFSQLEQIPEQWREYEIKFSEMVRWMDGVDASLKRMFEGVSHDSNVDTDTFDTEKEEFQVLCKDVDARREDMKWLVQKLDQLVAHRADDSGLSKQKRLEGLLQRYKSLMPVIEKTRGQIDTYSRSHALCKEIRDTISLLEEVRRQSAKEEEHFPDTEDACSEMVRRQEDRLRQLESQRSGILMYLQRAKELQRDTNCPAFVGKHAFDLDSKWQEVFGDAFRYSGFYCYPVESPQPRFPWFEADPS